jgi:nucleosome assembly protein 1-like 1
VTDGFPIAQARLNDMVGRASGYLDTLPPKVKARIEFLRDLQKKHDDLEEDFNKELDALNAKYQALYSESLTFVWA